MDDYSFFRKQGYEEDKSLEDNYTVSGEEFVLPPGSDQRRNPNQGPGPMQPGPGPRPSQPGPGPGPRPPQPGPGPGPRPPFPGPGPGPRPPFPGPGPGPRPPFPGPGPGPFPPPPGPGPRPPQPMTPPPNFIPELPADMRGPDTFRLGGQFGSNNIWTCFNRFTYVWLINGSNFWFFPTFIGRNHVEGFRWRGNGWVYERINLRLIFFFLCF